MASSVSAAELMRSAPGTFRAGTVLKHRAGWCAGTFGSGCGGGWAARLLVVKGGFLFKFKSKKAARPLGLPIDLAAATVTLRPHTATDAGVDPAKCFSVGTLRRALLFQCDDAAEAAAWVRALHNQADTSIKAGLGHLRMEPSEEAARATGQAMTRRQTQRQRAHAERAAGDPAMSMEAAGLMGFGMASADMHELGAGDSDSDD